MHAVSDVSFSVSAGETFGLVGESGCGKTTIGRMVVALEKPDSGEVRLNGENISALRGSELRTKRRDLQLMFQDPYSSLDPRMRVGAIIKEPLSIQRIGSAREQQKRVEALLDEVGLPRNALERYPHEFSGGQRQRIGLARALTLNPRVIVADEPVSALDVSIRAQVLNLMKRTQADHGLTLVVISHDLAVVKYMANRIGVMYLGKLVEIGSGEDIYLRAAHHYTAGLLATIPVPEPAVARATQGRRDQGRAAQPDQPAVRLPVPHPLPGRTGPVRRRRDRSCAPSGPATWPPAISRCRSRPPCRPPLRPRRPRPACPASELSTHALPPRKGHLMTGYLLRRAGTSIVVLIGVSIFVFFLLHMIYPSPAIDVLGQKADPLAIAAVEPGPRLRRPVLRAVPALPEQPRCTATWGTPTR